MKKVGTVPWIFCLGSLAFRFCSYCTYNVQLRNNIKRPLKGHCHEIFRFWFFSWISFPPAPDYTSRPFQIFSKIRGDICSSRCTTGVVDTGGKWEKSSIRIICRRCRLPPVSLIPVVHLDLRISLRIFEKNRNCPNGILWGWGETDSWKTRSKKSRDTVPLLRD